MILVIDNYDSFSHNLARYIRELGWDCHVVRNDAITPEQALARDPLAIVLSPGPCTPTEAGVCLDIVKAAGDEVPLLGVCLGHQAIAQAYGYTIRRAARPLRGKATPITHDGRGVFQNIPSPMMVGRYHSLVADLTGRGPLVPIAHSDGANDSSEVMALAHQTRPQIGIQFHPESILTEHGYALLKNFMLFAEGWRRSQQALLEAAQ